MSTSAYKFINCSTSILHTSLGVLQPGAFVYGRRPPRDILAELVKNRIVSIPRIDVLSLYIITTDTGTLLNTLKGRPLPVDEAAYEADIDELMSINYGESPTQEAATGTASGLVTGDGSEVDPTVNGVASNAFGVATGFEGQGPATSFVIASDLGTDFDVGNLTPNKVNVKNFTPSLGGKLPPSGTANELFYSNLAGWRQIGEIRPWVLGTFYPASTLLLKDAKFYQVTADHVASGPTDPIIELSASSGSGSVSGTPTIVSVTNGSTGDLLLGQLVYITSSGLAVLARADNLVTKNAAGLVSSVASSTGQITNVTVSGTIEGTLAQWQVVTGDAGGLVPGKKYYLSSAVAGRMSYTPPDYAASTWCVPVGIALSPTEFKVDIGQSIKL